MSLHQRILLRPRRLVRPDIFLLFFSLFALLVGGCNREVKDEALFQEILSDRTGINFHNTVVQDRENNVLSYPYYFNGGGVAV